MISAVLLAAGNARRFGGPQKLLALVPASDGAVPLVRHSASGLLEAGLRNIVVVTGRDADQVRGALHGMDLQLVFNPDYSSGLSTSLKMGIAEAMRLWPKLTKLLVALGDQPLTGTGIIERLVSSDRTADDPISHSIVAPRYRGELGNPVLLARELVPDLLLELTGDRGARNLIERNPTRVRYVDFDRPMPVDVDTVGDLADLTDVHHE
jgi:molybdenum cofactor cytidylyltransferase